MRKMVLKIYATSILKLAAHLKKKYNIDTVVYTAQPFDFSGNEHIGIGIQKFGKL